MAEHPPVSSVGSADSSAPSSTASIVHPTILSPAISMQGVQKSFGGVTANDGASLEVGSREIHALVGENGAGKSTLMRVLAGLYSPDAGSIEVNGKNATGWSTADAIAAGVGMVHQHFMLVPTLTVAENVVLGAEPTHGLQFDRQRANKAVATLCEQSGLHVDPNAKVANLSVGEAQRVEILKVLYRGAKILILDEPTAVLSPPEVTDLWKVLRNIQKGGGTVVLITHKLDEVMAVSDTITVMRAGKTISRFRTSLVTPNDIARAMVGRDVALHMDLAANIKSADHSIDHSITGSPLLRIASLKVNSDRSTVAVDDLSFDIRPGEIFGIAGVEGNGQTELIEAIAGLRSSSSGSITLGNTALDSLSVRQRADAGLSHIPEDRQRRGLVMDYSIADNLVLGRQHHFSTRTGINHVQVAENAQRQISAFDIRPANALLPASALSGGNQQKIVIAREMGRTFTVLLAAQPTRGVDVGAIEFIHAQLRKARNEGKAVLLVSADLTEVLALSNRIAVMYRGRFVTVLPRASCSTEILGPYMTGAAA